MVQILVVGDLMLDRYTFGSTDRVSPEAPVLILKASRQEDRLGGAASVSGLSAGLGASVSAAGVVGSDPVGDRLLGLLGEFGVDCSGVLTINGRLTTLKERFAGQTGGWHQILRVDWETTVQLPNEIEAELLRAILSKLSSVDVVLVSDYAKGVCSASLLQAVIFAAKRANKPVLVDPARNADYTKYCGATMILPNRSEVEQAVGAKVDSPESAMEAALTVREMVQAESVVIKLDSDGMVLLSPGKRLHIPAEAKEVFDVIGAGDTVLATLGICLAQNRDLADSVRIANVAAGLQVQRFGVAPVTWSEISGSRWAA